MRLPGFIRNLTISASLRGAFLTGALLTLVVSGVSLYSWHEQSSQIRYAQRLFPADSDLVPD